MSDEQARYEVLVTKAVDGVISADERTELDALVKADPERAAEMADFESFKAETDAMTQRILQSARSAPPRASSTTKAGLNISFGLIFAGLIGLVSVMAYLFMTAPEISAPIKVAAGVFGAGVTGLMFHVIKTRMAGLKSDPYQEIDR